jgi:hypothetical protein
MPIAVPSILLNTSRMEEYLVNVKCCKLSTQKVNSVPKRKTNAVVFNDDPQRVLSAAWKRNPKGIKAIIFKMVSW